MLLDSIKYDDTFVKFHDGINYITDKNIIDIAITSFGGFTDAFEKGNGRRIELMADVEEFSVNTFARINRNDFHFVRCYTTSMLDTKEIDKKQDIVKYAKKLSDKIKKTSTKLPLIAYYNDCTVFDDINFYWSDKDVLKDRSYGYSNCLIVKNKFENVQKFFVSASLMYKTYSMSNTNSIFLKNYDKAVDNINDALKQIGYSNIYYSIFKNALCVKNQKNEIILVKDLEKELQIYLMIVFDLNLRSLILNPFDKNPTNADGCIGITYNFNEKLKTKLLNILCKKFNNLQILIY